MKKVIIIIALLASIGGAATAQDTLWQRPHPLGNYFYNNWIDTNTSTRYMFPAWSSPFNNAIATEFVTKDTLTVYGIAAMMVNRYFAGRNFYDSDSAFQAHLNATYPVDPTLDNLEESLLLFQYHWNGSMQMQQLGDSLKVHEGHTPPSYYIMSNRPPLGVWDTLAKPVYERYFTEPQTVHDTFYAGFTQSHFSYDDKDSVWYHRRPYFVCPAFDTGLLVTWSVVAVHGVDFDYPLDENHLPWWERKDFPLIYYIFPIITPPDTIHAADTIIGGSDTVAYGDTLVVSDTLVVNGDTIVVHDTLLTIVPGDLLQRLTGVQPNPAATVARVVSSAGITALDSYTLDGRRLHTQHLDGAPLTATIDVSRWPAGTYLLRIRTPMGTALKKLTVAR